MNDPSVNSVESSKALDTTSTLAWKFSIKERPSWPMEDWEVRSILSGQKTQTIRVLNPQSKKLLKDRTFKVLDDDILDFKNTLEKTCRYGQPGNHIWVREAFAKINSPTQLGIETNYRATYTRLPGQRRINMWISAIYMPKEASRILLEIVSVRVQRLQSISETDAWAEGMASLGFCFGGKILSSSATGVERYAAFWESINGAGSWAANPWVWVIEFKRIEISA